MGAVRSLRFSPDGSVLAAAEPADFVDLFDVASNYESRQTVRLRTSMSVCYEPLSFSGRRWHSGLVASLYHMSCLLGL